MRSYRISASGDDASPDDPKPGGTGEGAIRNDGASHSHAAIQSAPRWS